jgi:hypothetical protein
MAGSSSNNAFEPNNWVYDTGTCRNLVNMKDFFINYTPFLSLKIFSSANGTIVRAMGVAPSPNSLRTSQLIESVLYRRRDYESSVNKKYQGHWLFYTRILNANKDWLPLLFPRMEYTQLKFSLVPSSLLLHQIPYIVSTSALGMRITNRFHKSLASPE